MLVDERYIFLLLFHDVLSQMQGIKVLAPIFVPVCAGASIHPHLGAIFPPVLALASQRGKDDPACLAAQDVTRRVTAAVAEDGSYLLVAQVWLS